VEQSVVGLLFFISLCSAVVDRNKRSLSCIISDDDIMDAVKYYGAKVKATTDTSNK
jgi:hypothetical protein